MTRLTTWWWLYISYLTETLTSFSSVFSWKHIALILLGQLCTYPENINKSTGNIIINVIFYSEAMIILIIIIMHRCMTEQYPFLSSHKSQIAHFLSLWSSELFYKSLPCFYMKLESNKRTIDTYSSFYFYVIFISVQYWFICAVILYHHIAWF